MNLAQFDSFFLNDKNISLFLKEKVVKIPSKEAFVFPTDPFWQFYIAKHGTTLYIQSLLHKNIEYVKMNAKIQYLEEIKKNRHIIVKKKMVKSLEEVESNLMEEKTNFPSILVLAFMDKINILFVMGNSYHETINNDSGVFHIMNGTIELNVSAERIKEVKKNRIERINIHKVLKSVSSYKLDELQHIYYDTLGVEKGSKMTKQQLYDSIINYNKIEI